VAVRQLFSGGTLRITRFGAAAAVLATGALLLSACSGTTTSSTPSATASGSATGGTVTVAEVNQFSSFNMSTATGNSDINAKVELATRSNFNFIDADLKVQKDTSFGTYTVLSQSPLTVKYTVNPGVTWSDGVQVGAADLMLAWAVYSGYYNSGTIDASGKVTKGTNYFDYAGTTTGLGLTSLPQIGADGRSITLTYSKPYADWEISFGVDQPAHVVAQHAGLKDEQALIDLFKSAPKGDAANPAAVDPNLRKVADFYNTGFDSTTLPTDPSLYLADGPYVVSAITENQSVTLVKNPKYTGTHTAKLDSIVMRTIGDPQAQIQALQNGEVDIVAPQSSADTLAALKNVPGVTVQQGDQLAYDHLDLNFSGALADPKVREAFLKTVPRQAILDAIITPQKPGAQVLNSQLFVPSVATQKQAYADVVKTNDSSQFAAPDIAGAKALLNGATPTVKILYNKNNPNRVDEYTLIAQSASQAGFKIVDDGDPKWSSLLGNGSYDASLFGWTNPGVGVSGVPQIFGTGQSSNFNGFSNPAADQLMSQLITTTDTTKQMDLQKQIDKSIFDAYYGLPLFQSVGVLAFSNRVQGLGNYQANQYGVWWNVWDWSVSK
jgi:peptide/nickel transport system substrate-binding protein